MQVTVFPRTVSPRDLLFLGPPRGGGELFKGEPSRGRGIIIRRLSRGELFGGGDCSRDTVTVARFLTFSECL